MPLDGLEVSLCHDHYVARLTSTQTVC